MGYLADRASIIAKHGSDDDLAELAVDLRVATYERPYDPDIREAQGIIEQARAWRRAVAIGRDLHR